MQKVLVIDDDRQMRIALSEVLRRRGYEVVAEERGESALVRLSRESFGAVVTDVKMPGMSGLEVLRSVKRVAPHIPVLMVTAFGTIENAIEAMKEGAKDYILKPFSPDHIDSALKRVISTGYDEDSGIVTRDEKMKEILDIARGIAPTQATVLITGESGTGKELLARYIHRYSNRSEKPFVAINCASIPDGLLESELFGYEKGAFTGAVSTRKGKFEMADGGTLLLDEVGEMGLQLQAKLLRVIQQREIDRLGGSRPVQVDIRIIATTNRELAKEVREGRFREDLFYRLNVFPLRLPPLRERREDIPLLADYFLKCFCQRNSRKIMGIDEEAMESLKRHPWKGNVRELENVIERAVLICRGDYISKEMLFYGEGDESETLHEDKDFRPHPGRLLKDMERDLIYRTLKETDGNKTKAAKALGISIRTLRNKLKEYSAHEAVAI